MFPVGSRYETEKMNGVSHYIEHLMFKGTTKRPSTLKLTREIDRLGAEYNAFTSKEYTGYYIKTDVNFLETSCDILSDMLFNSLYDVKEIQREKTVIVEEIRMYKDNPLLYIDNAFEELMYRGSHLGRDIAGTEKHVMGFKREDVLHYRDTYYQPHNMLVVAAGNVNEKTKQIVEEYFGRASNQKKASRLFDKASYGSSVKKDRIEVHQKKTDQSQLMLGFPGFNHTDTRIPALGVMNTVLGGSMSSRLFIQIRERRGLAYTIRSGAETFRDSGYVFVRAGLEAKNINKAVDVMKVEIEKICNKGIMSKELQDAKTHTRGALTLALEDSSAQASYYAREAMFFDTIETPNDWLKKVDMVSNDDIIRVAREVFDFNKIRVAVIGDIDAGKIKF